MVPGRLPSIATTTTRLQNRFGAAPGEGIPGEEVMFWIIRLIRDLTAERLETRKRR